MMSGIAWNGLAHERQKATIAESPLEPASEPSARTTAMETLCRDSSTSPRKTSIIDCIVSKTNRRRGVAPP